MSHNTTPYVTIKAYTQKIYQKIAPLNTPVTPETPEQRFAIYFQVVSILHAQLLVYGQQRYSRKAITANPFNKKTGRLRER